MESLPLFLERLNNETMAGRFGNAQSLRDAT